MQIARQALGRRFFRAARAAALDCTARAAALDIRATRDGRVLKLKILLHAVKPAATHAATQRYGLTSEPGTRISRRVDFALPGITRTATVRLSTPQLTLVGAQ